MMKFSQPSLHGHSARICAPVTLRPVMYTPARSGLIPLRSQNEVRVAGEPAKGPAIGLARQVERDGALPGVHGCPIEAVAPGARRIASLGLDLDHVRAEVGQYLSGDEAERPGDIENAVRREE